MAKPVPLPLPGLLPVSLDERIATGLRGRYAADVAAYAETPGGDVALDLKLLLTWARMPSEVAPLVSGEALEFYRHMVRALAGLAGIVLGDGIPESAVTGRRLTVRQEAVLAAMVSAGTTMSTAGSYESLRRRGLAEPIPGWRWPDSPYPSWRLTAAGIAGGRRALMLAGKACGA